MADEEQTFPPLSPEDVKELTEDQEDKQNGLKGQAVDMLEDGKLDLALEKFSEAIAVGCASALLYSRRAQVLMQLGRPGAAANDCGAALAINPDSAKAFKIRARANLKLEKWEEAHADFQTALKVDYDEQTYEDSLEVAAKVKELSAAATKQRVKGEEAEYHRKLKESKEAYEAGMRANEERFREERMKEEEEKKKKEEERKARVQKRQQEEDAAKDGDGDGVPKAHAPPGTEPAAAPGAEEVD